MDVGTQKVCCGPLRRQMSGTVRGLFGLAERSFFVAGRTQYPSGESEQTPPVEEYVLDVGRTKTKRDLGSVDRRAGSRFGEQRLCAHGMHLCGLGIVAATVFGDLECFGRFVQREECQDQNDPASNVVGRLGEKSASLFGCLTLTADTDEVVDPPHWIVVG